MKSITEDMNQSELFEKIGTICAAVNVVVDAKELLEVSLKETMELFGAKRGSIFILKDNSNELILKIAQGMKTSETDRMIKRLGEGIVGHVAEHKQPVFVDDIANDKRFGKDYKPRGSYATPSFICAPLIIKDSLIGVINISDKESGHRFAKEEMQLLDLLSSQIALNYRRVQLYNKFRTIVKETKDLKDQLGRSDEETKYLKKQVIIHEKLATIGKLAGGIAHEFNNPLDGVMRYTNLCLEHVKDDEIVRGYLLEVKHGLNRMANIVKNLLACSRSDVSGQNELVDFKNILEKSLSIVHSEISYKNITVEKNIDGSISKVRDIGLERILSNLIRNAVEAMQQDGKLTIFAAEKDGQLRIEISDTGCGIEPDAISKVFEPFYTTKDIDKGCGLGLTIVGEIVKGYSGHVDVESEVNKGTKFIIDLPLEK